MYTSKEKELCDKFYTEKKLNQLFLFLPTLFFAIHLCNCYNEEINLKTIEQA